MKNQPQFLSGLMNTLWLSELGTRGLKHCLRRILVLLNVITLLICTTGQVAAQTKVTYFHNDLSGNPVAASDSTGQVIWRESFRPYGERLKNDAASQTNSQWYTGHRQDADTGLVYMGARHYDPLIGRFLSIDPAGLNESDPHSFNRYAYANNNPMKFTDPDGRFAQSILLGAGVLLVGGTAYYATTTNEQRQEIADGFRALGRQFSNLLNATADNGDSSSNSRNSVGGGVAAAGGAMPPPNGEDPNKRGLSKEDKRSIQSYEKRIAEHEQKIAEFKENPTVRPGMENQPREVIERQQAARIKHLETEIKAFQGNIEKIISGQ